ncbi:dihydroorotate dehydrogenase [Acetonema longum]|uniref:Dihydroorotate dehydrogenase n=1 Tax=Acetonema longum DSM 6540 TaxID=1009370 RepID=F7NJ01_9FIRM|nr:dihydroorotate dehydrogenase [Acetonema longum]EGO63998.1 dihydroorotate oxidase B, catalytic subunit [Acetonema longum DSM 6540]
MEKHAALAVRLGRMSLKNPLMPAAGTFSVDTAREFYDINKLGAIVAKTITPLERRGNETPRAAEVYGGMLNSVGLQNPGLEAFLRLEAPKLTEVEPPVIISIAGHSIADFALMAQALDPLRQIAALEVNVSCPNVACGGRVFAADPVQVEAVVAAIRRVTHKYLIIKLSPNVGDITEMAAAAEHAGGDCLCLANTLLGMKIDIHRRRPVLANIVGGMSGPAVKPVILRMVYQTYSRVKIPLIGVGGIATMEDVLEYMMAGASAVQVGTAAFTDPLILPRLIDELAEYADRQEICLADLIGVAQV